MSSAGASVLPVELAESFAAPPAARIACFSLGRFDIAQPRFRGRFPRVTNALQLQHSAQRPARHQGRQHLSGQRRDDAGAGVEKAREPRVRIARKNREESKT